MDQARRRQGTQHRFPLAKTMKTMNVTALESLGTIDTAPLAPWSGISDSHLIVSGTDLYYYSSINVTQRLLRRSGLPPGCTIGVKSVVCA